MSQRSLSAPVRKELARKTSISLNFRKKKKMQRKRPCKKHRFSPVTSKQCALFLGLFEVESSIMIEFSYVSWRLWMAGFYWSQMHLHRYCLYNLPPSHWKWAPNVSINADRIMCLWKQGVPRAHKPMHMEFQRHLLDSSCQTPFMPPQGTSCDSLLPQESITVADFSLLPGDQAVGTQDKQWESLEQAAPLVAESFPHPRPSSNLSQLVLLWLLLSCLLLCSLSCTPAQALQPSSASFLWYTDWLADMWTTPSKEQIPSVSKSKVPQAAGENWQRAQTEFVFALHSLLFFTWRSQWHEMGLGDQKLVPLRVRNHFR